MSTVVENINQAKSDLLGCKAAIIAKGVELPSGTPTSDYAEKIASISGGADIVYHYDGRTLEEAHPLEEANVYIRGDVIADIPNGYTSIAKGLFSKNPIITEVIIPDSVRNMEGGVYHMGGSTFDRMPNLQKVTLSKNIFTIPQYCFFDDNLLTYIEGGLPDGLLKIEKYAFSQTNIGGHGLSIFMIPDGVTEVEEYAFAAANGLYKVYIPKSVTTIGDSAFLVSDMTDVYYEGTQAEFESITGISQAGFNENVTYHYEYTPS